MNLVPPPPRPSWLHRRRWLVAGFAVAYAAFFILLAKIGHPPFVAAFAKLALGGLAVLLLVWLLRQVWRRILWRVGRRLAFSYLLVGLLPLALLALLAVLASYMLGGFLLGHLYRDAVSAAHGDLEMAALARLRGAAATGSGAPLDEHLHFAEYLRGERIAGGDQAPAEWPAWLAAAEDEATAGGERGPVAAPLVALHDQTVSLAATAGDARHGVVAWLDGDLAAALRRRSRAWVEILRADDPRSLPVTHFELGGTDLVLRGFRAGQDAAAADFYRLNPPHEPGHPSWTEQPFIVWIGGAGAIRELAGGTSVADSTVVSLAASPSLIFHSLLSKSRQSDSTPWIALAGVSVLLFEIWVVAAGVAIFMIVGLSRAVNRLSRATEAVGHGDFSFRIPVRRRDQVGELQRSFNDMAEHLAELVDTAAQKEALDKELELARRVQRDLLPDLIEAPDQVDIATMFEPSAAIGGDYFDILPRPSGRLAVVIADVAGHGLAAGLRMAMVKSALALLADEELTPSEILERLQRLMRSRPGERGFVTLTLSEFSPADGELSLINAGHPPCYLVRAAGQVEEIALPSSPLGGLPGPPSSTRVRLASGDAAVWLSDGIPECSSAAGDPFGYERLPAALAGPFSSATELRDRLLTKLRSYCGDVPVEDDRTLVVLRYDPLGGVKPSRA